MTFVSAQTNSNPFDIQPRAKAMNKKLLSKQPFVPANPFDIKQRTKVEATPEIIPEEEIIIQTNPQVKRELFGRFFFITALILGSILTVFFILFRLSFMKMWRAFLNDNMLSQVQREQGKIANLPYLIMNLLFFSNLALLITTAQHYLELSLIASNYWNNFLLIFGIITGLFLLKHLVLKVISYVFNIEKELRLYAFTITIFSSILGLLLLPLNVCTVYLPEGLTHFMLGLSALVVIGVYIFRSLRGIFIGSRYLSSNLFHFLLYICAVEIAPFLILFRWITNLS